MDNNIVKVACRLIKGELIKSETTKEVLKAESLDMT